MTKKKRSVKRTGVTAEEFESFVDEGFQQTSKYGHGRGGIKPEPIPDHVYEKLVKESARPGLSRGAAAFNSVLTRCLGLSPSPPTDSQMDFLKGFDKTMRQLVPVGELRDDHDAPSLPEVTGPAHGPTPSEDREAFLKNYEEHMESLKKGE